MKVLVIPDVHLKPWMFDEAEKVSAEKYDKIVCLGDLVDDMPGRTELMRESFGKMIHPYG